MRYFAREGNNNELLGLYRFGMLGERIVEQYFANGEWHDDSETRISAYLAMGEGWYAELNEEQARVQRPEAFK
jgi:hypothetical protein